MTRHQSLLRAALIAGAVFIAGLSAAPDATPAKPDAAWLEKAKAAYPLKTCVVSDEQLGEMGDPIDFVYEQTGQPPRLVRFCCKHCKGDFLKDPAKFLKTIDEAAAKAAPAPKK